MDSTGATLLLDGGLHDGQMVLEGVSPPATRHRITWMPSASGDEVRQFWESSDDDGATWTVALDGRYRRLPD